MDTKLTLSLNRSIIEQAKIYAKANKVSLSKLIESYLGSLTNKASSKAEITPLVESLIGVIDLEKLDDTDKSYTDFLIDKYQ